MRLQAAGALQHQLEHLDRREGAAAEQTADVGGGGPEDIVGHAVGILGEACAGVHFGHGDPDRL